MLILKNIFDPLCDDINIVPTQRNNTHLLQITKEIVWPVVYMYYLATAFL